MNKISKALTWFIISFIIFHLILFIMWGEHQEYWYLYTGIMLIAGISYVFYQRDIESKRLLTSIGVGIITAIILIMLQLLFSLITSNLSYSSLIKELARTGVNWKWQMLVTLLLSFHVTSYIWELFYKRINTFFNTEMDSYINNCNLF